MKRVLDSSKHRDFVRREAEMIASVAPSLTEPVACAESRPAPVVIRGGISKRLFLNEHAGAEWYSVYPWLERAA